LLGHGRQTSSIRRRLTLNFASGIGSQVVTVVQQLASVPVLLMAWGEVGYGVWLAMFSLAASLGIIAEFGFSNAVASDIGMRCGAGDEAGALIAFQTGLLFALVSSVVVLVVGVPVALLLPQAPMFKIPGPWQGEATGALLLFIAGLPLAMLSVLYVAAFRGERKMAQGVFYYYVLGRFIEMLAVLGAALAGASLVGAATAGLVSRLVIAMVVAGTAHRQILWLRFGVAPAPWLHFRRMLPAAMSHMAAPATNVASVTGVNLLVLVLVGPVAVTTVTVIRTLGNLAYQAYFMLAVATWPEISALMGAGQKETAGRVLITIGRVSFWMVVAAAVALIFVGEPVLRFWTRGKVEMIWSLFVLQLLAIMVSNLWRVPSVTLQATNQNRRMAVALVLAVVISLAITAGTLPILGLAGVGIGLLAMEVVAAAGTLKQALALSGVTVSQYLKSLLRPPDVAEVRTLAGLRKAGSGPEY
jgi:O-antigen/teichoic acid export membrane protein